MKGQKKKQNGITLIALVISIIVMLILAGVSINALMGDNGILRQAQFASFMSEMAAVEEAVQLWGANHYDDDNHSIPAKGAVQQEEISNSERLGGEIGYYRTWSRTNTMPSTEITTQSDNFNSLYLAELVFFPGGIEDLYYLDNEGLDLSNSKKYVIDAENSMVYSVNGISLNGVRCYSLEMAKAVMNGTYDTPNFIASEVSGAQASGGMRAAGNTEPQYIEDEGGNLVENPNYNPNGFQIISDNSSNIYKLYNNGDLYGKGLKGTGLQSNMSELNAIDSTVFSKLNLPSNINIIKIIQGRGTIYYIDNNNNLYAVGNNSSNKLGLTEEQQIEFTGREMVKLDVAGKKVENVFDCGSDLFVVTTDNKLYGAGANETAQLGLGNRDVVYEFKEITINGFDNPKKIYSVEVGDGTIIWYNDAPSNLEENTEAWAVYNKFFYSGVGRWGFGGINNNNTPQYLNFSRIWDGTDGSDIDGDILYCSATGSNWILKKDGTVMQTGYGGSGIGSGWIGGGSSATFKVRTEATNQKFTKMWYGSGSFILLHENGTLWGVSSNNTDMIGDSTRNWTFDPLENVPFDTDLLKEVLPTSSGIFYLLTNGKVYYSGSYSYLGLGSEWVTKIDGIVCVSDSPYNNSFPSINSLYGGNGNTAELIKPKSLGCCVATANSNIFLCTDGEYYLCANSSLMFGNDILQQNWKIVAQNVKYFESRCPAYIDNNNNLYVAGSNSDYLGLNYENKSKVKFFTEIEDERIKGKAKKVQYDDSVLAVLTTDGNLYATGLYYYNSTYYYPGYTSVLDNSKTLILVDTNVKDMAYKSSSRMYLKNDNSLYGFGYWRGWTQSANSNTPKLSTSVNSNIIKLIPWTRNSYVLDEDGVLWYSGDNGYSYGGMNSNTGDYKVWTGNIDGKKVKNEVSLDGNTHIILTEDGYLYGWGNLSKLGLGTTSTEVSKDIRKLPIENVDQICAGSGFFVLVKSDGSVWGTGSNIYGVLGRWKGAPRTSGRYRTAFEWVECPELEI